MYTTIAAIFLKRFERKSTKENWKTNLDSRVMDNRKALLGHWPPVAGMAITLPPDQDKLLLNGDH